jgi:hypothetical protein
VRIARALIEKQRRLAYCHDPLQPPKTLWVSAELDKRLSHCTTGKSTHSSGRLRSGYLCFEPEFPVVEHPRAGFFLQSRSASCRRTRRASRARRKLHVPNAETALYPARIPHYLFGSKNRFASKVFMVPDSVKQGSVLTLRRDFRNTQLETVLIDADTFSG